MYIHTHMTEVNPSCPTGYILNADFCSCEKIPPPSDPDKTESPASPAKSPASPAKPPKRKRCPNGTRKNKEGVCVPKATGAQSAAKKRTRKKKKIAQLIQTMNDALDRNKAKTGKKTGKNTRKKKSFTMIKNLTPSSLIDIREELPPLDTPGARDMYSPSLNKLLVQSVHRGSPRRDILDGIEKCFHTQPYKVGPMWSYIRDELEKQSPSLKLYVGNRCLKWNSKSVVNMLLRNLAKTSQIKAEDIIAPRQLQSNCWFNCGFMIHFISDSGRKFSKYLRQYMITGNITPEAKGRRNLKLRLQFFILNIAIEASIQGHPLALELDTNDIIDGIYKSFATKPKPQSRLTGLVKSGVHGNPMDFYQTILRYLTGATVHPVRMDAIFWVKSHKNKPADIDGYQIDEEYKRAREERSSAGASEWIIDDRQDLGTAPDIMRIIKDLNKKDAHDGGNTSMEFTCEFGKYRLDSSLIGDTTGQHFCSMVTINGKYYAFDGNSFSKLSPFNWPGYLNNGRMWGFEGSTWEDSTGKMGKNIIWDFANCYYELYYYRVSSQVAEEVN
jgi:hypothetical protein